MPTLEEREAWNERRRAEIIRRLQAFYQKHGRSPTQTEMACASKRDRTLPSYGTIAAYLGSMREAFIAAGIPPRAKGENLTRNPARIRKDRQAPTKLGPRPCVKCDRAFTPETRRGKLCARCRPAPKQTPRPEPKYKPIFRPDFLLALPELRRELARFDAQPIRHYNIEGRDPADINLPSLKRPRRRVA